MSEIRHAGLVARRDARGWRGVLIEGPSGAGKSTLALSVLAGRFRLVADDRVVVWACGGQVFGRAPPPLAGLIEVRGVGVLKEPALDLSPIALIVRPGAGERLPEPAFDNLCGAPIPLIQFDFGAPAAAARLDRALSVFDAARKRGI